jgi:hypothetical protein
MYCTCDSGYVCRSGVSSSAKKKRVVENPRSTRKPDNTITMRMIAVVERLLLAVPLSFVPRVNRLRCDVSGKGEFMSVGGIASRTWVFVLMCGEIAIDAL